MRNIKFLAKYLMQHRAPMYPVKQNDAPGRQERVPGMFCADIRKERLLAEVGGGDTEQEDV